MYNEKYTITEYYFGRDLTPIEILKTGVYTLYVCMDEDNTFYFYDHEGYGACQLSYIDIEDFDEAMEQKLKD